MNTLEAIHTRRSVRSFMNKPVPMELLDELVRAAMCAPSAGNQQPWQFVIVDDRILLNGVMEVTPNAKMCKEARAAILVCGDTKKEKYPGFWVQDCSAATENLLLAAHERGLGAVWTGIYPIAERVEGFRGLFELPEHVIPLCLVPIGYPAKAAALVDRFQAERVHHNKW